MSDLRPVAFVAISPDVIAIHPSNPAKDLKQFIANAKDKSFTYGSAGAGTGPQIGAEYFFKEVAKVKYVHVPFQGGAPAITATLGNHVDALVLTLPPVTPHIRSGALRGLGVASDKRNSAIPDVPTYGEMGYPNVYSGSWVGFFAPAKTPDAVVEKLNAEINAVMKEPDLLEKLAKAGFDPVVEERRRGQCLLQERSRELGQDGQRHRLLELSALDGDARSAHRREQTEACAMNAAPKTLRHLSDLDAAGLDARRQARRAGTGRRAIRRRHHAGDGRADRPRRSARSDRAPVRARSGRARRARRRSAPIRSAITPTARSRASCTAIPTACCSSSRMSARSIAASASGARWSAPAAEPLTRAAARRRARLHRRASGNLGGHPHRRRSAGAVGAPAQAGGRAARRDRRTSRSSACTRACRSPIRRASRPELVRALKAKGKATYVVLHANHARELTDAAREACARLIDAGIPMLSQSVLLARRQRRSADARRADARAGRMPHQAVLPAPRRSRARHVASAHLDRAAARS